MNKVTAAIKQAARKAAESGQTPLDYMLKVMRDETANQGRRDRMAQAAAPYLHDWPRSRT